jgi:peptidoglycan/LPS O-acetylase OafA/YrhL
MLILNAVKNYLQRRPTEGGYIAEVDGLRFIAIFAVVIQHLSERLIRFSPTPFDTPIKDNDFAFFISRGTVGVFLFFAISGFVLCLPFAKNANVSIKSFYLRRLERIEPPYLIWMSFFALILVVKGAYSFGSVLPHWLASITYTHWLFFGEYSVINPVAWSLEIEIQFYLLAPFLALGYFNVKNIPLRRIFLTLFIIVFILIQGQLGWLHFPMKANLLGRLPNFLVGFLVADFYLNDWKLGLKKSYIWDFIAIFSFITLCYSWTEETFKTLIFNLALILLFVSAFKGSLFSSFLAKPWIAITGGMCYTIYLTHLPLLEGITRLTAPLSISSNYGINLAIHSLITLPILFISAIAFFIFTEKPFMKKNWYKDIRGGFSIPLKKVKRLVFPAFLLFISVFAAKGQDDLANIKVLKLRPLDELTDLALINAPSLKVNQVDVARQTLAWKIQKGSWADMITVNGATLYGNGSVLDANNNGNSTAYILTDRRSLNFNVSLGLRLSGSDFVTRGKKSELQRLQLDRLQQEKQVTVQNVRETVAILYTQLELALKMLRLKAEAVENQKVAFAIAEKYFKEGNFQPTEYSNMLTKVTGAEEQYETAKAEAKKLTLVLKNLVGASVF